jgi:hypothetical protein
MNEKRTARMKRTPLLMTFLIAIFLITACAGRSSARANFALTPEAKLALGTIKLEGTPQAVDSATAAKLLPLWQLLQQLSTSSTAAPQETQAVLDQIRATMAPSQVSAMDSMQFSQTDILAAFQQGRTAQAGTPGAGGTGTSRSNGTNRGNGGGQTFSFGGGAPGGGIPGGGFGGGGFGGGGGGTGTATASQGGSASRTSQTSANRSSTFLVGEVIRLLQSKIAT